MSANRPVVLAVTSDHHANSTVGLCPDEGVHLDDDGTYMPSKAQLWQWECWQEFWSLVGAMRRKHKAQLYCEFNGDLFEGDHHHTSQIISRNPEPQAYVAGRVFGVPKSLRPDRVFVVRGTEAHVGPAGASEEAFARIIKAERNPETKTWSWWHLRLEIHGRLFDFKHHGRMGQRPWTRHNVVSLLAADIFYQHAKRGLRHPDVAFRSHYHTHEDSGKAHPVRAIQTPAWQLKTAHAHKVVADNLADIGGIIVTIMPDGQYEVQEKLFEVEAPAIWRA